ncbi:MAG TPA: sigma-70 family RNA polymerase sigma factor [Verrucomicrobiae bacterium]|nr:sigma-70 family RNA polymerase sigma factor [Verrucomicrobiae bacterium]
MATESVSDAQLVEWSLTGDRDAFGRIVERYQSLVCSITYGATGSLSLSEDIAQDTFVTAWRKLEGLSDATKLRAWLCGIARNLTNNFLRRGRHEPMRSAQPLDEIGELPAAEPLPSAEAVSREEEAILWRALERIPETYREPLILFYRQHRSVERVAEDLELSQDAVKQRLSRGRKLLADEVATFVEGTLERTTPGKAFTLDVLGALPLAAASTGAASATAATKSAGIFAWVLPIIGAVAGFVSHWMLVRETSTARERRARSIELIAIWVSAMVASIGGQWLVNRWGYLAQWSDRTFFVAFSGFWWFCEMIFLSWFIVFFHGNLAARMKREAAGEVVRLKPTTRLAFNIGGHLAVFSWLISIAWGRGDRTTAGIVAALMVGLAIWSLFNLRGLTGLAAAKANSRHFWTCIGLTLVVLNLRLDAWMAAGYKVSVAEIHQMFPMWIVPALSLTLALWTVALVAMTWPKRSA